MRMAALSLLLVLAACGGAAEKATPDASTTPANQPVASPTIAPPTGTPVPEALSQFRCDPDGAGTYQATGVVKNSSKQKVDFQVTVHVGEPSATPQSAMTQRVPNVAARASAEFSIATIPAPAEGGTCHVQVLTTK
jgi:hypothetical protein